MHSPWHNPRLPNSLNSDGKCMIQWIVSFEQQCPGNAIHASTGKKQRWCNWLVLKILHCITLSHFCHASRSSREFFASCFRCQHGWYVVLPIFSTPAGSTGSIWLRPEDCLTKYYWTVRNSDRVNTLRVKNSLRNRTVHWVTRIWRNTFSKFSLSKLFLAWFKTPKCVARHL